MGENKKLQGELQKLCAREAEYMKIVQPWQDEVLEIALQVDAKISEFKAMKSTVVSLLEASVSAKLVNTTRECIDQIDKDLAGLKAGFAKFKKKIKNIVKIQETTASGSGMNHK